MCVREVDLFMGHLKADPFVSLLSTNSMANEGWLQRMKKSEGVIFKKLQDGGKSTDMPVMEAWLLDK